jgi:hypothetical protein
MPSGSGASAPKFEDPWGNDALLGETPGWYAAGGVIGTRVVSWPNWELRMLRSRA